MKSVVFLSLLAALAVLNCSPTEPEKNIQITKVNWFYQNFPADYSSTGYSMSLDVKVYYKGDNISSSDIASAKMKYGTTYWNLHATDTNFNDSLNCIDYLVNNYCSNTLSSNRSVMPIGTFDFEITLNNGTCTPLSKTFSAPGKTVTGGYKYVYTEDFTGSVTSEFTRVLKRPAEQIATKNGDTLLILFTINDTLAYNGWIWLFDSENAYLGRSDYFRNFTTHSVSKIINEGRGLKNDGSVDSVKIADSDCVMSNGALLSQATVVRVVCSDGVQYADTSLGYDYRSVSKKLTVSTQ